MKSEASDPREQFLARVNFGETRFKAFKGFVFLCGGPNDPNSYAKLLSARHLIYRELTSGRYSDLADRLRLAEDIQNWFRGGLYSDLVTFEEHLASLSSVILLVVESPGSIAELGAFSVATPIGKRLIAVIDEHHYESESFIRLGPINRLEKETGRAVMVYDWYESDPIKGTRHPVYEKLESDIGEVLDGVRELLKETYEEQVFRSENPGHAMILICELCDLFGALTEEEIHGYLQKFNSHLEAGQIKQYLFLLQECKILSLKSKGHGRYYYVRDWGTHITFSFKDGQRVDRDRMRVEVVDYYKQHMKTRAEVVRLTRRSM